MTRHFRNDLDLLRKKVLALGGLVEAAAERAITAFVDRRADLAAEVIEADGRIDAKELEVETECLKILALHQPFAQDLRFLITVLKVNNDLERIGDLATNISESAQFLAGQPPMAHPLEFPTMASRVQTMVGMALDALLDQDPDKAREVLVMDDEVDRLDRLMSADIQTAIREDPTTVECSCAMLRAIRDLERIADLSTNVAEDVVFLVEADLIRHGRTTPIRS